MHAVPSVRSWAVVVVVGRCWVDRQRVYAFRVRLVGRPPQRVGAAIGGPVGVCVRAWNPQRVLPLNDAGTVAETAASPSASSSPMKIGGLFV